jgi:hypothetical protein
MVSSGFGLILSGIGSTANSTLLAGARMEPLLHNVPPEETADLNPRVVRRRVEITVEREVLSVVYQPAASIVGHCVRCGGDVLLLSAETAATAHGVSPREIYRWMDEKDLHINEFQGGPVYICSESLKTVPAKELP